MFQLMGGAYQRKVEAHERMVAARAQYLEEKRVQYQDAVSNFVNEAVREAPRGEVTPDAVYALYCMYVKVNGISIQPKNIFFKTFKELIFYTTHQITVEGKRIRVLRGFDLNLNLPWVIPE